MIFQILLIISLIFLAIYAYFQWRRSPVVSGAVSVLAVSGITFAVAPNLATKLAQLVGVGRGADLIIYCFVLISLAAIFNLHLRFRASEASLTEIVRAFAIARAQTSRLSSTGEPPSGDATQSGKDAK